MTDEQFDVATDISLGKPHNVVLFNDTTHGMEEVAAQIIKAIKCDADKALAIMLQAHYSGRAIVITTHQEHAEQVASVLEEIRLGVKVEPVA